MAESENYGNDWTEEEVNVLVADYFDMLRKELAGETFVKAEHRRGLLSKIDRTSGSIEFKHQNVSAVLDLLGLEWVTGYRPAANFQNSLVSAVERVLEKKSDFSAPEIVLPSGFADRATLFLEAPPTLLPSASRLPEFVERLARKYDPVERDFRNRKLGEAGEEFVFNSEIEGLRAEGRTDLAQRVSWASKEEGDGLGFDIKSFDLKGREKFIEVKTTVGSSRTPFFMTRNEKSFAEECDDRYRIFRLYDFRRSPKGFELSPPLEKHLFFRTETYRASFSLET